MTYAQLQFVKAEAAFRSGDKATALTAYRNGISAHIDFVNARNLDANQATTQITSAEKTAFLGDTRIVPADPAALTLTQIMTQKYIAQWGWGHNEMWMDMRRYHYTDIDPATARRCIRASLRRRICSATTTARSRGAFARDTTRSTSGTSRRSRPSAATRWTTTRNPRGSSTRNPAMTRIRLLSSLLGGPCARGVLEGRRPGHYRPDGRLVHQVLQLRRERAERELFRQRCQGDGDQLDELHAADRRRRTRRARLPASR